MEIDRYSLDTICGCRCNFIGEQCRSIKLRQCVTICTTRYLHTISICCIYRIFTSYSWQWCIEDFFFTSCALDNFITNEVFTNIIQTSVVVLTTISLLSLSKFSIFSRQNLSLFLRQCDRIVTLTETNIFKCLVCSTNQRTSSQFNRNNTNLLDNRTRRMVGGFCAKYTSEYRVDRSILDSHHLVSDHDVITDVQSTCGGIRDTNRRRCGCNTSRHCGSDASIHAVHSATNLLIILSDCTIVRCITTRQCEDFTTQSWSSDCRYTQIDCKGRESNILLNRKCTLISCLSSTNQFDLRSCKESVCSNTSSNSCNTCSDIVGQRCDTNRRANERHCCIGHCRTNHNVITTST